VNKQTTKTTPTCRAADLHFVVLHCGPVVYWITRTQRSSRVVRCAFCRRQSNYDAVIDSRLSEIWRHTNADLIKRFPHNLIVWLFVWPAISYYHPLWPVTWLSMSRKNVPTYFCSVLVKYELISIKISRHVLDETLNRAVQRLRTSPKICASTTLRNLKWQTDPSTQFSHVHFNESLNSYKHDWQLLPQKSSKVTSCLHRMLEMSASSTNAST